MPIEIRVLEESPAALAEYARVPIELRVERIAQPVVRGDGGFDLVERAVSVPWIKSYDALPDGGPTRIPSLFDVSKWGFLAAWVGGERVGGAILAFDTPDVHLLEGRRDLAVVWDLRVAPRHRGRGVGSALLGAAQAWAHERGCVELDVETQDVNAPACRFYARRGATLKFVRPGAYPELPDEVQLLWAFELRHGAPRAD